MEYTFQTRLKEDGNLYDYLDEWANKGWKLIQIMPDMQYRYGNDGTTFTYNEYYDLFILGREKSGEE